uniref:C2H2-type domain-containing protein n=1 Tax=Parascaris equorum TaxID=6256 RepID=A0A914RSK8_PAREQ
MERTFLLSAEKLVCGKVFCHSSSLSRHRMQAHFKSYTCTQCNQEISRRKEEPEENLILVKMKHKGRFLVGINVCERDLDERQ